MPRTIHAHVPFPQVQLNLDFMLSKGVHPEIFFTGEMLDNALPEEIESVATALHASGLSCTIHSPFMDLNPGSDELLIREATRRRFKQICDAALILRPLSMVFHPGYDRWRYGEKQAAWLGHSIETFSEVLRQTEPIGCTIAIENIFEEEPSTLLALIESFSDKRVRHCFDVGHWNLFHAPKIGLKEWFNALGAHMGHLHIHDNSGTRDDHAPIGEGNIDFELYFSLVKQYAPDAIWALEAHSKGCLERAVSSIAKFTAA
ncbi:MAG: sugar phosphate isomerase/epimerase [Geobacteraceae bacterium]|nr:sugar phosphate isomerase/epimerase [Geobacteraceae bacterium]